MTELERAAHASPEEAGAMEQGELSGNLVAVCEPGLLLFKSTALEHNGGSAPACQDPAETDDAKSSDNESQDPQDWTGPTEAQLGVLCQAGWRLVGSQL